MNAARALSNAIDHPELIEEAYPDLAHIRTAWRVRRGLPTESVYESGPRGERIRVTAPNGDEAISAYLHELYHAIAKREGWRAGGSPLSTLSHAEARARQSMVNRHGRLVQQADLPGNEGWLDGLTRSPSTGEFSGLPRHQRGKEIVALEERIRSLNQEAFARYWALASERAARNVQKRRTMTPRQRLAIPPWETED